MSNPTTPEAINETDYWKATERVQELLANNKPDELIGRPRIDFYGAMRVVDESQQRAQAGATTGKVILDHLIASGQLMTPETLEELAKVESKLVTGEPALLQQGFDWKLGVLADDHVVFSHIDRRNYFGSMPNGFQELPVESYIHFSLEAKGSQTLPVGSYIDFRMDPLAIYQPGSQDYTFGAVNVERPRLPLEAGSVAEPLPAINDLTASLSHEAPADLLKAWRNYSDTLGRRNGRGSRDFAGALLVGRSAVERGLGISLEQVLKFVSNTALSTYVAKPFGSPAPSETV